jgi:hypothetical protein
MQRAPPEAEIRVPSEHEAVATARAELERKRDAAAAAAAAQSRRADRVAEEAARRSGEADSPALFSIVQASVARGLDSPKLRGGGIFDPEEAARLEADINLKMAASSGSGAGANKPNVSFDEGEVMVITWWGSVDHCSPRLS